MKTQQPIIQQSPMIDRTLKYPQQLLTQAIDHDQFLTPLNEPT